MWKSGHNKDGEIHMATSMSNKTKVSNPREDVGKVFRFLKCWELVWDLSKFPDVMDGGWSSGGETNLFQKDKADDEVKACKNEKPIGQCKAKEDLAVQHVRAEKVKLAEVVVRLQKMQEAEITRCNEILLFTNGPRGSE